MFHSLAHLLGAGVPVGRSVEVLLEQKPGATVRLWLLGLHRALTQQACFSDSIALQAGSSEVEKSLIQAGERSGKLPQMLAELADYYALIAVSEKRTLSAFLYPLGLLHLGIVLPELQGFFGDESAVFIVGGLALKLFALWVLLVAVWKGFQFLDASASKNSSAERILAWVPFYGSARAHSARARFAKVVEVGLLAALRMPEIFHLAGKASQSARVGDAAERIAESTARGESLSASFAATDAFTATFRQSIVTAELSGTLDTEMKRLAHLEKEAARAAYESAASWTPKLLTTMVSCYVGFRIVRHIMEYYAQIQALL